MVSYKRRTFYGDRHDFSQVHGQLGARQIAGAKFPSDTSSRFTMETAYENRDSNLYASISSSGNDITDIVKTQDNPTEHRIRFDSAVSWYPAKRVNLKLDFGYEYCRNFNFNPREDAHHFRGGLTLVAKPLF